MPNIKSAEKRCRTSEAARLRNRAVKRQIHTVQRKFEENIEKGDRGASAASYAAYCSVLDKAVKKGVVSANLSARSKSRRVQRLNALA